MNEPAFVKNLITPHDLHLRDVFDLRFPLDQVDNRQKALFAAIRHIWATL